MTNLLAAITADATLQPYADDLARVARSSIRLRPYVPDSPVPDPWAD